MRIKDLGYREAIVQKRELTFGELQLAIIERYVSKGVKEVQLIEITSGVTAIFNSIEDVVRIDWSSSCKIELINMPHAFGTTDDNKTIIIIQLAELESDKVI